MGKHGFMGSFQGIDAFGKTLEDVKIRTRTGALLTLVSFSIILTSVLLEFIDYRRVTLEPSLEVDRSRGEKLVIDMDITFPRVPCYLLSLDVMDISGERQNDISHAVTKIRVSKDGELIDAVKGGQLKGEAERAAQNVDPNYCGSCYGATPPTNGCCNTCDDVRQAYLRMGWSFTNPDGIEQCVDEGWSDKMSQQNSEGCRIAGKVKVNKVVGNIQYSHGKTFMHSAQALQQLVPYLKDGNHHDFGHIIHKFHFGADVDEATRQRLEFQEAATAKKLNIRDPLEGLEVHGKNEDKNFMFQYFAQVVSTTFVYLGGEEVTSNQYSITQYERDLSTGNQPTRDQHGTLTSHHTNAVPGLFIHYEISPMKIVHTEGRQSFAHFLTSTCAIVGGVLTVAGILDSVIFNSRRAFGKEFDGYGSMTGKMM